MGDPRSVVTPPEFAHGQVSDVFAPAASAFQIRNLELGPSGTLQTIAGPCPMVPDYGAGYPADTNGRHHGLFHARIGDRSARDITLAHVGDKLLVFKGWIRTWGVLLSGIPNNVVAKFPTMFACDGKRIFFALGQGYPIYGFDGERLEEVGFHRAPSPPVVLESESGGQIGTVDGTYGEHGGVLPGVWDYHVQLEDIYGDLSPASAAGSIGTTAVLAAAAFDDPGDLRKRFNVAVNNERASKVRGARLFRSGDRINSTQHTPQELYTETNSGVAFPDRVSAVYPDKHNDAKLGAPMEDLRQAPRAEILCIAMGRMWAGREYGDQGILYYSKPGRMGTYGQYDWLYPDPNGAPLSALARVREGILAATETTTFLVRPNTGSDRAPFESVPVPGGLGYVAPRSLATLPESGETIGLGIGGFYAYRDGTIRRASDDIRDVVEHLSKAQMLRAQAVIHPRTGEYLCAVPTGATTDLDLLLAYKAGRWREADYLDIGSLAVTADHRRVVLAGGRSGAANAIWVLDHEGYGYAPPVKQSTFQSRFHWLGAPGARSTVKGLILFLREEGLADSLDVSFYKDGSRAVKVVSVTASPLHKFKSSPLWGTAAYNDGSVWHDKRAHHIRVPATVSDAESVAFKITTLGKLNFIGYAWVYAPRSDGGGSRRQQ